MTRDEIQNRRYLVQNMRADGWTFHRIAQHIGVCDDRARQIYLAAIESDRRLKEDIKQVYDELVAVTAKMTHHG